jgi:hypothetical protein
MKNTKITICALCFVFVASFVFMKTFGSALSNADNAAMTNKVITPSDPQKISEFLKSERVVMSYRWQVYDGGEELSCLVRSFDSEPGWPGAGEKLSILNKQGKLLYETTESNIWDLSGVTALRNTKSQLIYRYDSGGSGMYFVQMLDYQSGKIVELLNSRDNDFDSFAEVRPSFRKGITPSKEPFEIFLSKGFGLASPFRKDTCVYRYKDGSYRLAGRFSQQQVDDYIEDLMANRVRRNNRDR